MALQETPPPLARFLGKLEGVRHDGGLQYQARCPAHDDREPSLSVWWGDKNKVVFHDQAGCEPQAILDTLGVQWKDLEQPHRVVATYDYEDADGELAYQALRYEPKEFRQRRPDPASPKKWLWSTKGIESLPYKLPELAEALRCHEPVWIVEGEKDVQAMQLAYDVVATTNHAGAGKWTDSHSRYFIGSGSSIRIVADRDPAGYKHALAVYDSLLEVAGITAQIVAPVPDFAKADAADHIRDNNGLDDFIPLTVAEVTAAKNAEEVPKNPIPAEAHSSGNTAHSSAPGTLVLRAASDIVSHRQKFLWEGRIPLGNLALFAGRGGVGKSTFAIWLAVEAQFGRLPGDLFGEPVTVLYVSVEDHWETQMKPRLIAAGANMSTFYEVAIGVQTDEETGERIPMLPEDTHLIRKAIEQTGAQLVILDPITSTMPGDDHKRHVVRAVLDPIAKVAQETASVIVGIMHFNKGGGNASDKASGSHAYRDAARSMLLFARDEDADHVVMSQDKGNYAEYSSKSLAYQLLDTTVELDDGDTAQAPRVEIIGETDTSVSQIINRPTDDDSGEVVHWLSNLLAEHSGRIGADAGLRAGQEDGYTKSQLTRGRKRSRPPIVSKKTAMDGGWEWQYEESARPEGSPVFPEESASVLSAPFRDSSGQWTVIRPYISADFLHADATYETDRTINNRNGEVQ